MLGGLVLVVGVLGLVRVAPESGGGGGDTAEAGPRPSADRVTERSTRTAATSAPAPPGSSAHPSTASVTDGGNDNGKGSDPDSAATRTPTPDGSPTRPAPPEAPRSHPVVTPGAPTAPTANPPVTPSRPAPAPSRSTGTPPPPPDRPGGICVPLIGLCVDLGLSQDGDGR
ncbi:hypothetical protein AB0F77_01365 [Streptomyces sp. NPDC026672]|uniref:hypothetical protein n=1 Tax=unclassified Streptomyces TaxID=2593676 RepID=UPI0033C7F036